MSGSVIATGRAVLADVRAQPSSAIAELVKDQWTADEIQGMHEEWRAGREEFSELKLKLIDKETKKRMLEELWNDRVKIDPDEAKQGEEEMQAKKLALVALKKDNKQKRGELLKVSTDISENIDRLREHETTLADAIRKSEDLQATADQQRLKTAENVAAASRTREQLRESEAVLESTKSECDNLTQRLAALHKQIADANQRTTATTADADALSVRLATMRQQSAAVDEDASERNGWYDGMNAVVRKLSGIQKVTSIGGSTQRYELAPGNATIEVVFDKTSSALVSARLDPPGQLDADFMDALVAEAVRSNSLEILVREVQARLEQAAAPAAGGDGGGRGATPRAAAASAPSAATATPIAAAATPKPTPDRWSGLGSADARDVAMPMPSLPMPSLRDPVLDIASDAPPSTALAAPGSNQLVGRKSMSRKSFCRAVSHPRSPCSRAAAAGVAMDAKAAMRDLISVGVHGGERPTSRVLAISDAGGRLLHSLMSDGAVLDAAGAPVAYIEANGTVGTPSMEFLGEVTAPNAASVGFSTDMSDELVAEVDYGLGVIRDPSGSTIASITRVGEVAGHSGSRCGTLDGFNFELMRSAAAYLTLVAPEFLAGK